MKISVNWLKQYIDIPWEMQELADRLTMTGLEVEGVERYETIEGGLEGITKRTKNTRLNIKVNSTQPKGSTERSTKIWPSYSG